MIMDEYLLAIFDISSEEKRHQRQEEGGEEVGRCERIRVDDVEQPGGGTE